VANGGGSRRSDDARRNRLQRGWLGTLGKKLAHRSIFKKLLLHTLLDSPVVALAGVILGPFLLDECLVETEVVTDTVLPARVPGAIELEVVRDPLVDLRQRETATRSAQDGHADEVRIAV